MIEIKDLKDVSDKELITMSFLPLPDAKYDEFKAIENANIPECSPNGGCEIINHLLDTPNDLLEKEVILSIINQIYEINTKIKNIRQRIIKEKIDYDLRFENNNEEIRNLVSERNSLVYNLNLENDEQTELID